ncbi:hypothetical protein LCGC14_0313520 [marine sediment metagenome]|uniref:Uncharacterized protein n=1 Tax=marine sediment metagenome TaxID=412755 RepID=A0A0F9TLQ9_9ZZZZ
MAVPTGVEREIYASPHKFSDVRVRIRLDRAKATQNFVDEFGGGSLDDDLFDSITPPNGVITVAAGKLSLSVGAADNGYPIVWSRAGKTFPFDRSIGYTLEWTMDYTTVGGFGTKFQIIDLQNADAIVTINNDVAEGYSIHMPTLTEIENLGASHTTSHDYEFIYVPATNLANATYELKRDTVSKGTIDATNRHAWVFAIGNGRVQDQESTDWSQINVARVDVNLDSNESEGFPEWSDRDTTIESGETWGFLPWLQGLQISTHERNGVDQAVLDMAAGGHITGIIGDSQGPGHRSNMFAGYQWLNREVRIESRQGDGARWTSWKEVFRGLLDEPQIISQSGQDVLRMTARDKNRRLLQMAHIVQGWSDNGTPITGAEMNKTTKEIMERMMDLGGLVAADYNVGTMLLKPRTWQVLGESAIDALQEIADDSVMAITRNAGSANPGRVEVQDFDFGTGTPTYYLSSDEIVALDWAETNLGMTAQVVTRVEHSEFAGFAEVDPPVPVPPYGARISRNARVAQTIGEINGTGGTTRRIGHLWYRAANRELNSIVVSMLGQDWIEHGIEMRVLDRRVLGIHEEDYITIGWDYLWSAQEGWRCSLHLVNQRPENTIMSGALDKSSTVAY